MGESVIVSRRCTTSGLRTWGRTYPRRACTTGCARSASLGVSRRATSRGPPRTARCPPRSQHPRSRWTSLFHPPFFRSTQTKRGRQEKDRRGADSLGRGGSGSVRLMHNFTCRRMRNRASCHASGRSGQRDCSMQRFWAACKSGS